MRAASKSVAQLESQGKKFNFAVKRRLGLPSASKFTRYDAPLHQDTKPGDLLCQQIPISVTGDVLDTTFTSFTIRPHGPQQAMFVLSGSKDLEPLVLVLQEQVLIHATDVLGVYYYFKDLHEREPTYLITVHATAHDHNEDKFAAYLAGFDFLLRQYTTVLPFDQNHDPSPNNTNCVGRNLDRCGLLCSHWISCAAGLLGGVGLLCAYCCKKSPCCQPQEVPYKAGPRMKRCLSCSRRYMLQPLICVHTLSSLFMLPIRLCGLLAGNCIDGKQEGFAMSKGWQKCCEDTVGGAGNGVTRVLKAEFMTYRYLIKNFGNIVVDIAKHRSGLEAAHYARECTICTGYPADILFNLYYLYYQDAYGVVFAVVLELFDQILNRDVYSEGPVLLQGWLSLRGGRLGLPDTCAKPQNVWVVIRPWSITCASPRTDASHTTPFVPVPRASCHVSRASCHATI